MCLVHDCCATGYRAREHTCVCVERRLGAVTTEQDLRLRKIGARLLWIVLRKTDAGAEVCATADLCASPLVDTFAQTHRMPVVKVRSHSLDKVRQPMSCYEGAAGREFAYRCCAAASSVACSVLVQRAQAEVCLCAAVFNPEDCRPTALLAAGGRPSPLVSHRQHL